jgi:MFS superfamily sulfate permease-like transporter
MFKHFKADFGAAVVVFLVAVPLCLGIAVGSGAEPFSGILAGIVGGVVIGFLSNSQVSVSGPAAGLTAIVAVAITELKVFEVFLLATVIAGVFQIVLGAIKAGKLNSFFPNAVIKGMLAAIGVILILKQIPHAVGYNSDYEGDETFFQSDGHNTITELFYSLNSIELSAAIVFSLCAFVLFGWQKFFSKIPLVSSVPPALFVVILAVLVNELFLYFDPKDSLGVAQLISIPIANSLTEFAGYLRFPDFSSIGNAKVWLYGFQIALVASIESLLSVEAADRLDVYKRNTNPNKELYAQGAGNIVSGLIGGLPLTSVIIRSSVNINSGNRTKLAAILHGVLLLVSVMLFPQWLNKIPLCALAAVLIYAGYKLISPSLIKAIFNKGYGQFIPFMVTLVSIVFTDLLIGVTIGILVGLFFALKGSYSSTVSLTHLKDNYLIRFRKDVSFFHKDTLKTVFSNIPNDSNVVIDTSKADYIDTDVLEMVEDFILESKDKGMTVEVRSGSKQHLIKQ